ncbi:MAG: peptidoglycan editing factor PgeF [Betaproteobacteria bacterium]
MTASPAAALNAQLANAGLDWILPDWPAPPNVCAFVTTRKGGVSTGPYATMNLGRNGRDEAMALVENRHRFAAFLPSKPVSLNQVHGAAVAKLSDSPHPVTPADAAVTREFGVVCSILTADCLPVLFTDRSGSVAGVAHAGWRGLAAGVLGASVNALADLGAGPDQLLAWLGPAIGPAAFEVGADVHSAFCDVDAGAIACFVPHCDGKWHADLYGLARRSLARAGVTSIHGGGYCTYSDSARFFSYRRERDSGRMAAAVWLAH